MNDDDFALLLFAAMWSAFVWIHGFTFSEEWHEQRNKHKDTNK